LFYYIPLCGAVITIQTDYNIENPLLPRYLIGVSVRDMLFLEFSSTMVALILAGKVGSSISSELGTMRITEQIDALEIMGINSASYLILPKIIAAMFFLSFSYNTKCAGRYVRGLSCCSAYKYYHSPGVYLRASICFLSLLFYLFS